MKDFRNMAIMLMGVFLLIVIIFLLEKFVPYFILAFLAIFGTAAFIVWFILWSSKKDF